MRRTHRNVLISSIVLVMVLCGGAVFGYVRFVQNHEEPGPEPVLRALTLDQVQTYTRLTFPAGTRLVFGEFYVLDDWAVAAHLTFEAKLLPEFLRSNGLPAPKDGLRTVPAGVGDPPVRGTSPSGPPSLPDGALESPAAGTSGSAAPVATTSPGATASPPTPPTPAAGIPSAPGELLGDDARWHPEAATAISGIDRVVRASVARWLTFDLDDPDTITVYVYAVAEIPLASESAVPSATRSASASASAKP